MDGVAIEIGILRGRRHKGMEEFRAVVSDGFGEDVEITFLESPDFLSRPAHEIARTLADLDDDAAAAVEAAVSNGARVTLNGRDVPHPRMRGPMGAAI